MANWTSEVAPFSQNRTPILVGWASDGSGIGVPVAVDPATGRLLVNTTGGADSVTISGPLGSTTAAASVSTVLSNDYASTTLAKLTDGTNTANVVAGDSGFNGVATASATKTYTFTTSSSGAQTLLANTPTEGFSWLEVIYTSVGSGLALTGQFAPNSGGTYINDNTTWSSSSSSTPGALGTTVNVIYFSPVMANYFQLNVTGLTSGTFSGYVILHAQSPVRTISNVTQSGTWTVGSNSATGSAVPANGFYAAGINTSGNLTGIPVGINADAAGSGAGVVVEEVRYNGSTWDRLRGNMDNITIFASAAQTTTQTSADQTNYNGRGVIVTLDVTSAGTGSVTLEIDMKDPVSGKYVPLLTGAAVVSNSTNIYTVYPGMTAATNVSASSPLPRTWRVKVTANNANSITYSVGASVIL